jgi:hypothetical protein
LRSKRKAAASGQHVFAFRLATSSAAPAIAPVNAHVNVKKTMVRMSRM